MNTQKATQSSRILVAEDDPVHRSIIVKALKKCGYRVHAVENGQQAVDALDQHHYDLILMDCRMPQVSGFEAVRRIRNKELHTGEYATIIAVTANQGDVEHDACRKVGMDDFMPKPITPQKLADRVKLWIFRRQAAQD